MTKLKDNLNSDWFKAKNRGTMTTVYVESDVDIPFWKEIFDRYATNHKFSFKSSYNTKKGKDALLKEFKGRLGDFLLICVDSDYDYLLPNSTTNSKIINDNLYIFQTYTYSIENYKCWHKSISKLPARASLSDIELINFEAFLKKYSSTIYELFIYYINNKHNKTNFYQKEFLSIISFDKQLISKEIKIDIIQEKIDTKIKTLKEIASNITNTKHKLHQLGVNKDNVYLFIQGHFLYDKIVQPILVKVVSKLKNLKQDQIRKTYSSKKELENEINSYNNKVSDVKNLLHNNFDFSDCPLILNIKADILKYNKKRH